jgi:hypothetical protein
MQKVFEYEEKWSRGHIHMSWLYGTLERENQNGM